MNKKLLITLLISTSLLFACSSNNAKEGEPYIPDTTDRGYLKITRNKTGYYDTDYLFVSENGYEFFAKGKNQNGGDASYTYVATWESSDTEVVIVDNMGRAKALKDGTATIKATYGKYSDEIEVYVKTYATNNTLLDVAREYRTTKTYEMPLYVSPTNAFIKYTFSSEDAIEMIDNKQFRPLKAGQIDVSAKIYTNEFGRSVTHTFSLNIVDNNEPYFKYNNEIVDSLNIEVPVNKYETLDFASLGIKAYRGDTDEEITSNIEIKEGTYNLKELGEYTLVLSCINNEVEKTIPLILKVIERETIITTLPVTSLEIKTINYDVTSDKRHISFSMSVDLPIEHEEYMGEVGFYIQVQALRDVSGQKEILDKYATKYFDRTEPKRITVTSQIDAPSNYNLRLGKENVTVLITYAELRGYGYDYIYYE